MEKQNKKIIGVDIGGTAIKFALMDTQGIIEKSGRFQQIFQKKADTFLLK